MPPHRQAQLYFGREQRPYGMPNVKMEASQPVTSARNHVAPQTARPINPEHIKQIITTADPRALQRVLLELCQVSPAFSGALMRGLAPHSTSAQSIISQHWIRSRQPNLGLYIQPKITAIITHNLVKKAEVEPYKKHMALRPHHE
ncbi:hypothetical protein AALT_g4974 [Alternaria alternata]|nr:hypothetical protein AALT_g4974 [Alternaria alternata]